MASDTRTRLIEATFSLVQQKGLHGASLNAILAESGAPRGSLYYHFPGGKEQLVLEAMLQASRRISRFLEDTFATGCDPARSVRSYVEAAAQELHDTGYVFGCPVAPVVLDGSGGSSALEKACQETLEEWRRTVAAGLASAGIEAHRAEPLAVAIVAAVEGALILARARRDIKPLEIVADELEAMVQGALARTGQEGRVRPEG